ncbi:MAG: hypothetical protein ABIC91_05485 [Nanoarchaeota archaeon]|nr:hypothetical protein [Nanoarchaeota archaeon]MBU1031006.1 hypothetical protein [Nanoarchaeota archaeon]MBU1849460.1 hypothetical protein [Nanoarchaeota archaeon]
MKLKKVMLSLGVGILAALFIGFFIDAIYPSIEYNDYCKDQFEMLQPFAKNQELCNYTYNQTFRTNCVNKEGMIKQEYNSNGCVTNELCDFCGKEFRDDNEKYNRNLFYITAPIGLLLILLGLYLPLSIDAIASGFLLSGTLTMIQITMRVFGDLSKWPRVIILGLELILVVWIGLKKVKEDNYKKRKK